MAIASTLLTALFVLASLQAPSVAGPPARNVQGQQAARPSPPAPVAVSSTERAELAALQARSPQLENAHGGELEGHTTEIVLGLIGAAILLWLIL